MMINRHNHWYMSLSHIQLEKIQYLYIVICTVRILLKILRVWHSYEIKALWHDQSEKVFKLNYTMLKEY